MLKIIFSQINKGYSIKQILESNPTLPFDHKYGNDKFITPNDFVTSVFQSLQNHLNLFNLK
jgi:hypothetical protein